VLEEREREMEMVEGERNNNNRGSRNNKYSLQPSRINNEDILLCIDVDPQCMSEMKGATAGPNGRPLTRLDAIKQAIILFVNAKLTINPQHRFAFATLTNSVSWVCNLYLTLFQCPNIHICGSILIISFNY
jgi:BRISC and BRCA1-A complex member 1